MKTTMKTRNLNYYYYVEYFYGIDFKTKDNQEKEFRERNTVLSNYMANSSDLMPSLDDKIAPHKIEFQTVYPGMLVGTGIAHAFGGKGEAALGLCLDYVTGMPYIPGSSVKGTLRSAFKHKEYIRGLLKKAGVENADSINIGELEARIFGNAIDKKKQYNVAAHEQDKFFDAVIVSKGKILATDVITPHRQNPELLELAAPNPITIIRIRPNTKFRFQFSLKEALGVKPKQKLAVFTAILKDIGIGAKTNVGYGTLIDSDGTINFEEYQASTNKTALNDSNICPICSGRKSPNYPTCQKCASSARRIDAPQRNNKAVRDKKKTMKRR